MKAYPRYAFSFLEKTMTVRVAKSLRPAAAFAKEHGFELSTTGKGHLCFFRPGCKRVFASLSPSDGRAARNVIADLRKSLAGRL